MKCRLSYSDENGKIVEEEFYVPNGDDIGLTNKLLAENEILKEKLKEKPNSDKKEHYIEICNDIHKLRKYIQENFINNPPFNSSFYEGYEEGLAYGENVLKEALRIKAEPEIVGEWIPSNPETDTLECSECGYNILSEELKTPYCPWCGAKMKNWEE